MSGAAYSGVQQLNASGQGAFDVARIERGELIRGY
jgi:hypothetical protein